MKKLFKTSVGIIGQSSVLPWCLRRQNRGNFDIFVVVDKNVIVKKKMSWDPIPL